TAPAQAQRRRRSRPVSLSRHSLRPQLLSTPQTDPAPSVFGAPVLPRTDQTPTTALRSPKLAADRAPGSGSGDPRYRSRREPRRRMSCTRLDLTRQPPFHPVALTNSIEAWRPSPGSLLRAAVSTQGRQFAQARALAWKVEREQAPGTEIDAGDRTLRAVMPPTFDNPTSTALYDGSTSTLFCVDSFGSIVPRAVTNLDEITDDELVGGMTAWTTFDSPWTHIADRSRFGRVLDTTRTLGPQRILSAHLPPA